MLSQYEAVALFIERAQASQARLPGHQRQRPGSRRDLRTPGWASPGDRVGSGTHQAAPSTGAALTRLGQRLQLLTSSVRDAPARQHTLRQTIQWSYDLLPAEEQQLFRRLSVFVNGCELSAVEAICQCSWGAISRDAGRGDFARRQELTAANGTRGRGATFHDAGDDPRVWVGGSRCKPERWRRPVEHMPCTTSRWQRKQHRS